MRVYNDSRSIVDTAIQNMLVAVDGHTSIYTVMLLLSASQEGYSLKVENVEKFEFDV